jgi:hypothetical protein
MYLNVYLHHNINPNTPTEMEATKTKAEILAELAKEIMEEAMENDRLTRTIDRDVLINDSQDLYIYAEVTVDMHREFEDDYMGGGYYNVVDEITIERLFIYADSEEWDLDQAAFLSNLKYYAK